ncbi:MAG: tyrosine-type recombinase/integrase [Brevinematales bacterium]|jgi:integrase
MENDLQLIPQNDFGMILNRLDISKETKKDYLFRIKPFIAFIQSNGLKNDSFIDYKRHLQDRKDLSISSKNKYLTASRIVLSELSRTGKIPDITKGIKCFKQDKGHKKDGLNNAEIEKVTAYLNRLDSGLKAARLKAWFTLLALQGLRQIEIIRLDVTDIDLKNGIAHVQGKGRDDKEIIFLNPSTVKAIGEYIKLSGVKSGALFYSLGNRKSERINSITIKRVFQDIFKVLEINKTVHGFRHYFITTLLNKMETRDVRKFSRHKNLEMLIVYDDEIDLREKTEIVFNCFESLKLA